MLHVLKNLRSMISSNGKATLEGEGGALEVEAHAPGIFSVFYVFDEADGSRPPLRCHPGLFAEASARAAALDAYGSPRSAAEGWDSASEDEVSYEFRLGGTRLVVEKANALVSVYQDGKLVHGGPIGHKDLVVPQYPLRAQEGVRPGSLRGKFNFRLEEGDAFFGLGEKTGKLDKRGRSFRTFNRDALGYDAGRSDPLYKSVPFLLKVNRDSGVHCGIYLPNLLVDEVNLGVESVFYYDVVLSGGPFGYYVLTGRNYREILSSYCWVTGMPALPPLFSFGYLTSSMGYAEPDDARERILAFFERVEREDIPCEGMYFSSGYAKADNGERYTFVWNRRKFPDPRGFVQSLEDRGYRVCCNVKPGILSSHPWYGKLKEEGVFIPGEGGSPLVSYYWGNSASFVDFSRPEGFEWWVRSLTENIIGQGVAGVWNDNNEFEIEDESLPIQECLRFLPVQMAQASYEALRRARPGKRPWLMSRSGYAGLQRYARTWTGDNVSSFDTLRYNIAMGMNLGLSGLPIYGHDLGGFVGPVPEEELLLRWCQSAVLQPRFVMHSWKPDGSITEPWLFPGGLAAIRRFIRERYRFLPYIYDMAIRAHETGLPLESPLALEFPEDGGLSLDGLDRMAGPSILVPAPPARGERRTILRFPEPSDWLDPETGSLLRGGRELEFDYPPEAFRYFQRCGTVLPTSPGRGSVGKTAPARCEFLVAPPSRGWEEGGEAACVHCEDDGESDFVPGSRWRWEMRFRGLDGGPWSLEARRLEAAEGLPCPSTWSFRLPPGFSFLAADGSELGPLREVNFEGPPGDLRLDFAGRYRNDGA